MAEKTNMDRIEAKVLDLFQKLVTSFKTFWKSFLHATENYLRRKTKHLPSVTPKGRREVIHEILEQKHHQDFLQKFAQESGIALDSVEETFRSYLQEIAADLNYLIFPFWDFLLTWVFETIYEGFEVDTASLDKIRMIAGQQPVVFVSNHRSHMDYLLLSYIFYYNRLPMPHVCAGANLSFWPLGPIFRKSGGFFIRRSYEGNRLYAAAVQAYIEELMRDRVNMEFFIEGGRSRTGKLLPPRMGILAAVVQSYFNGAAEDIWMIPTSVTYESVLEERSYLDEQAGGSKREEGFWDLFRLRKYLRKRKGKVYLQFGEPISMTDFLHGANIGEKKEKVQQLAYELTYGINKSAVVTPASLVATALLTHPRRSISEKMLEDKIDRYLDYLRFKECHLSEPLLKYRKNAIRESLKNYARDHLVEEYRDEEGPLYLVKEDRRPLLDYYKNSSLHFFVSMGVLGTILDAGETDKVPLRKVEEDYAFLQDLFQYEFTFSRRQTLRNHLEKLVEYLEKSELVRFEDNSIQLLAGSRPRLELFSAPLKNFIEGYYVLWRTLSQLGLRRWESKELLKLVQERGRILYLKEEVSHPESISKFTLQNALIAFRDLGTFQEEKEGLGKRKKTFYRVKGSAETIGKKLSEFLRKRQ